MATCVHFPEGLEQTHPHALSKTYSLSLSFYLSISLFPSLPPSLSLSLSFSLSLSCSPFLALPLLFPLPLSLLLSSLMHTHVRTHARTCTYGRTRTNAYIFLLPMSAFSAQTRESCKKQIRRWVKTRMPPAKKFLGTMPDAMQFDTWSDTPNQQKHTDPKTWRKDGGCFWTLKSMAESIQNGCAKAEQRRVLACASFKPSGGPHII